ncbi:MAG: 2-dehydropantoate 2-reductase N-terminal domain-containing protein, partial [Thermoplasmatota archaeon]
MGAGSIGTFFGASLARAGHDVTLVTRRADHVAAVNATGARVSGMSDLVSQARAVVRAIDAPR